MLRPASQFDSTRTGVWDKIWEDVSIQGEPRRQSTLRLHFTSGGCNEYLTVGGAALSSPSLTVSFEATQNKGGFPVRQESEDEFRPLLCVDGNKVPASYTVGMLLVLLVRSLTVCRVFHDPDPVSRPRVVPRVPPP